MRSSNKSKDECLSRLIASMGDCSPACLPAVLKHDTSKCESIVIAAACGALCAAGAGDQGPGQATYMPVLEALSTIGGSPAESAMRQVAKSARNSTLRIEAVRRLGKLAYSDESHALLHEVARDGFAKPRNSNNNPIAANDARVAALQSLAAVPKPNEKDSECVIGALDAVIATQDGKEVFEAALKTLGVVAKGRSVEPVLSLVGKAKDGRRALSLLTILADCKAEKIAPHKETIVRYLLDSVANFREPGPLWDRLGTLAANLSGKELLDQIMQRYSGDCLDRDRGLIWAAVLEAAAPGNEHATRAYLAFGRSDSNANRATRCVQGLQRHAAAKNADLIASSIFGRWRECPGYKSMLQHGVVKDILGSEKAVLDHACKALEAEQDQQRCEESAEIFLCSMFSAAAKDTDAYGDPQWRRAALDRRNQHSAAPNPVDMLVGSLKKCNDEDNPISIVAHRLATLSTSPGLLAIAKSIMAFKDNLAVYFPTVLLERAAETLLEEPGGIPSESALAKLESAAFQDNMAVVKDLPPSLVVINGRLNRYVLDLVRRRKLGFLPAVQRVMGKAEGDDFIFVLQELAAEASPDSFAVLAEACGHVRLEFRREALQQLEKSAERLRALGHRGTITTVLDKVCERFNDPPIVRLAAYRACGAIADPAVIPSLRMRQETDASGYTAIKDALRLIGAALANSQPEPTDSKSLAVWLKHIGELGDRTYLQHAVRWIDMPHPDRIVVLAALQCLSDLGGEDALKAVEKYLAEVSPSGELLQAARRAKAKLQNRTDSRLFDLLSGIFDEKSPVLSMDVDYTAVFGTARLAGITDALADALDNWSAGHSGDFITGIDGLCDVLNRHLFEKKAALIGVDQSGGVKMASKEYANRLAMTKFKQACPSIEPHMTIIHSLRQNAKTAHVENSDGKPKGGVGKEEAQCAYDQFKILFPNYVAIFSGGAPAKEKN